MKNENIKNDFLISSEKKKISVPYGKAVYGEEEIRAVVAAMRNSTQMGKNVYEFEGKIAKLFNKRHGVMVNSGSSANYLAVEIADLPKGSEVITPILTFSTTVAPLVKNGLIPSFVDVEESTYNIDANKVEAMITEKTRAMMIPNLLGNLPNWTKLRALADKYNLFVIEDSCDTLGATVNGELSGKYADISVTSFYGSHIITCAGNGGLLAVNNEQLLARAKLLRSWGRSSSLFVDSEAIENRFNTFLDDIRYDAKFLFSALGYNFEPSEIGAAFGLVQLEKLNQNIDTRTKWFNQHMEFFKQYGEYFILPNQLEGLRTAWIAFPLIVKKEAPFTRTDLQIFLEKQSIQTRTIFTGNILRQPGFKDIESKISKEGYVNADQVTRGGILLGCHHGMTELMMSCIHDSVYKFLKSRMVNDYLIQGSKE